MTIYTGFEIEIEVDLSKNNVIQNNSTTEKILTLSKLTSEITGTTHSEIQNYHKNISDYNTTAWRLEHDCSLDSGAEFISPPEPVDTSMEKVFKFFEHIEESGCTTTNRCGLHVNMSSDDMTMDDIDISTIIPLINQRLLFKLWGKRMKGNPNVVGMQNMLKYNSVGIVNAYVVTGRHDTKVDRISNNLLQNRYNFINKRKISGKSYIEIRIIGGKDYHKRVNDIKQTVEHFAKILKKAPKKTSTTYKKITSYVNRILVDVKNKDKIFIPDTDVSIAGATFKNKIKQINNIHKYNYSELIDIIQMFADRPSNTDYNIFCDYFSKCRECISGCVISLKKTDFYNYINYHRIKFLYNNFGKDFCLNDLKKNEFWNNYTLSLPEDEPKRNLLWIVNLVRHLSVKQRKGFVNSLSPDLLDFLLKHKRSGMINMVKAKKKELTLKTGVKKHNKEI